METPDTTLEDIIENILLLLPAVRVRAICMLSRRFKYTWRFCRDISFDRELSTRVSGDVLKAIISDILWNHSGVDARKFHLCFNPRDNEDGLIDIWVKRALDLGFQQLNLDFSFQPCPGFSPHPFPITHIVGERILCSDKLKILDLSHCHPNLQKDSLPNLQVLSLREMAVSSQLVTSVFAGCKSLQCLQFIKCDSHFLDVVFKAKGLNGLKEIFFKDCRYMSVDKVTSASLKSLRFQREGRDVQLKLTEPSPKLTEASLRLHHRFCCTPSAKYGCFSNSYLTSKKIYIKAPFSGIQYRYIYWRVEEFYLHVEPASKIDLLSIPIFLFRCPLIKKVSIHIESNSFEYLDVFELTWKEMTIDEWRFEELKYVEICGMKFMPNYKMLVDYFLRKSVALRDLILIPAKDHDLSVYDGEWIPLKLMECIKIYRSDGKTLATHLNPDSKTAGFKREYHFYEKLKRNLECQLFLMNTTLEQMMKDQNNLMRKLCEM